MNKSEAEAEPEAPDAPAEPTEPTELPAISPAE